MANNNYRAKQFMPFASLRGYYDMVRERQRIKEPRRNLSDSEAEKLSYKLNQVKKGMMVKVTYYNTDAYETIEGIVSNIHADFRTITIVKNSISLDDLLDISGDYITDYI